MKEILHIFNQIANTSSRTDKENLLRANSNNQLFKDILKFVYDPFIVTGLSSKKINKHVGIIQGVQYYLKDINQVMEYLKINNTGRDIDISHMESFYTNFEDEMQLFIKQIITKDLKIGITADTINKVYGEIIPTFDVMLAKKFDEHKEKVKGNFVITKKLDGNRIVVIKENGIIKSFTRQGNRYEGLEEIESDIINIPYDNIVFDGELIADTEGSTHEVYTETTSKARSKGSNKVGLIFHIFDVIAFDDFQKGKSKKNCIDRKNSLSAIFSLNKLPHCKEVEPLYIGNDKTQIEVWKNYALEQKWEGVMVNLDTPYVCKRTDTILKVKVMQTCDLKVIGFEEGTGKNVGRLGALIVDYKGFKVGVGSGFTDVDRELIWNNKEKYINKIVEIQYFEESKNQEGGISLRFPVFKKLRTDKTEPSYN